MAAVDYLGDSVAAHKPNAELELQKNLRRGECSRPLPANEVEDPCPQPGADAVQRIVERVPLEGDEISRPRAASCVLNVDDRHHGSVARQDVAGIEVGVDHVGGLWGGRRSAHASSRRSTRDDAAEEYPESRATVASRPVTTRQANLQ